MRTMEEWIKAFMRADAFWCHDNNPNRPHALLTSGLCSDGFFNGGIITEDPLLLDEIAGDLTELLRQKFVDFRKIDRVVGPAMGAITLAHDLARHISLADDTAHCLTAYAEKVEGGQAMAFKRVKIKSGEHILLVEDVVTTGGSVDRVASAIEDAGGKVLPYVITILNRSGQTYVSDRQIIPLVNRQINSWAVNECPLCKLGSEPIRPKESGNWARLTADYS